MTEDDKQLVAKANDELNANIIAHLRKALTAAEAGQITSLGLVTVSLEGQIELHYSSRNLYAVHSGLAQLSAMVLSSIFTPKTSEVARNVN